MKLLCIHGGLANGSVWREQVRHFGERYECVCPDLPGHGARANDQPGLPAEVADALVARASGDFVVLGHSVGGLLGLEVARRHPGRVLGVVAIESPITPPKGYAERARGMLEVLREPGAIDGWATRMVPADSELFPEVLAMMRATRLEVAEWAVELAGKYDSETAVRELRAPLLVIDGLVDEARLAAASSLATRAKTSGGSHYVQLTCAGEVNELVAKFLVERVRV